MSRFSSDNQWQGVLKHRDSGIRLTDCEADFTYPPILEGEPMPVYSVVFTCNCKGECPGIFHNCESECLCICPTKSMKSSKQVLRGNWMLDAVSRFPNEVMLVVRDDYRECSSCSGQISRGEKNSMMCGGCKRVRYCSRVCQKKHWVNHKNYCRLSKSELESIPVAISLLSEYNAASSAEELQANIERRKKGVEAGRKGYIRTREEIYIELSPISPKAKLFYLFLAMQTTSRRC